MTPLDNFLLERTFNHKKWASHFLNEPIDSVDLARFPYKPVKDGKATIPTTRIIPTALTTFPASFGDGTKPMYCILMPFLVRDFNDYQPLQNKVILLQQEAFGNSSQDSIRQVAKRVCIVIGQNRCASIDESINRQFESYIQQVPKIKGIALKTFGFLWKAEWKRSVISPHLYSKEACCRLIKYVRPEAGKKLIDAAESKQEPFREILSQIPYQQIREKIKNSPESLALVKKMREKAPAAPLYISLLDDDLIGLCTDNLGLFSHYDRLISAEHPDLATTGYRAADNQPFGMRLAVRLDMATRAAMASVFPQAPYYPEPNLIFLLKRALVEYSFIGGRSSRLESRRLIDNGTRSGLIDVSKMAFLDQGSLPTNVDRLKTAKVAAYDGPEKIAQKGFLTAMHGIDQTHTFPKQWADNLYLALGIHCRVTDCTKHLMMIYNSYDVIHLATHFGEILSRKYVASDFNTWMQHYPQYVQLLNQGQGASQFAALFPSAPSALLETYFQTKLELLENSRQELERLGVNEENRDKVFLAAQRCGQAIHQILSEFI